MVQPTSAFEPERNSEHRDEYELFVATDQAPTENTLGEAEETEAEPAGAGDRAVGVPTPPEVEGAPPAARERRQPVDDQLRPAGDAQRLEVAGPWST